MSLRKTLIGILLVSSIYLVGLILDNVLTFGGVSIKGQCMGNMSLRKTLIGILLVSSIYLVGLILDNVLTFGSVPLKGKCMHGCHGRIR